MMDLKSEHQIIDSLSISAHHITRHVMLIYPITDDVNSDLLVIVVSAFSTVKLLIIPCVLSKYFVGR